MIADEDLLSVIASSPLGASLAAISKRYGVSHAVSDAVFHTGDSGAVTALLGNDSAQIREETLDAIINAAPGHVSWHEPLVHRREVDSSAALRIAEFVADSLIEELAGRDDFESDTIDCLRDVVKNRLKKDQNAECLLAADSGSGLQDQDSIALAVQQVSALVEKDDLTAEQVMSALDDENTSFVFVATAQLAGIPIEAVKAIVNSHSAKALQALSWKAGFTANDAMHLQLALGRVPPGDIIMPRPDGTYDATTSEMTWQIELFTEEARNA